MSESTHFSEQEQADLVAYLDGELHGEAARTLEAKLSLNPAARAEADALRRTWELLDFLPRSQPSSRFTHRTLERLSPLLASGRRWRTRCLGLGWAAALLLAGWAGHAGYNWFVPREPGDTQERLRLSQAIRERQWIERLPRKVQADLNKLSEEARSAEVARLREQEREQRLLWKRPLNAGSRVRQPSRPADLSAEARNFIDKHLLPRLTAEEKRQYHAALGRWPDFPRTLKELAKHHPVLPPLPPPHKAIVCFEDLPDRAKIVAGSKPSWERREDVWQRLRRDEGKWPEWALTFHSLLSKPQCQRMPPLGASRPEDFSANIRDFIRKPLWQKVSKEEWKELRALQGKWPDYPLHLLRLAEKHKLEVPGMSLPGVGNW